MDLTAARALTHAWFPSGADIVPLTAGGFSGVPLFLVRPDHARPHVLKAFPAEAGWPRAARVHRFARHLRAAGLADFVPSLCRTTAGDTLVESGDGLIWEMVEHVVGTSCDDPDPTHVATAMHALARVHVAAATFLEAEPRTELSLGLVDRVMRARSMRQHSWRELDTPAARPSTWARDLMPLRMVACDRFDEGGGTCILATLATTALPALDCQMVLRDIWSDHVLFDPKDRPRVAGIIDLHAAGIDTPATDVGRLLGSWIPRHEAVSETWWAAATDAYETVRPLGARERRLVPLFAATSIIFGLDNWFRWTLIEGCSFPDRDRVVSRIDRLVSALPTALRIMGTPAVWAGLTPENSSP